MPHPHDAVAFGLIYVNSLPIKSALYPISMPDKYGSFDLSTNRTPSISLSSSVLEVVKSHSYTRPAHLPAFTCRRAQGLSYSFNRELMCVKMLCWKVLDSSNYLYHLPAAATVFQPINLSSNSP